MAFAHGSFALGDVALRARLTSAGAAAPYDTLTTSRALQVAPIVPLPAGELAAAVVPLSGGAPDLTSALSLERHYMGNGDGGGVSMRFVLHNNGSEPIEVGGFGLAMVFASSNACLLSARGEARRAAPD